MNIEDIGNNIYLIDNIKVYAPNLYVALNRFCSCPNISEEQRQQAIAKIEELRLKNITATGIRKDISEEERANNSRYKQAINGDRI